MYVNRDRLEAKIFGLQKATAYGLPTTWGDVSVEGRASKKDFEKWLAEAKLIEQTAAEIKRMLYKVIAEES
jgi:hypothetical protein